jgi:hypothetical protein
MSSCGYVLMVFLLVPVSAWAQPAPDPPPVGKRGSEPTSLKPDARPSARKVVSPAPPAPPAETIAPAVEAPVAGPVETPPTQAVSPAPKQLAPVTTQPTGRRFAPSQKPERRALSQPERQTPRITVALPVLSTDSKTHAYVIAGLSLAVLALGSGTLLTVLTRLRSTRQGLA